MMLALQAVPPSSASCDYLDVECQVEHPDDDGDAIADIAEGSICGRQALRDQINEPWSPGHCATTRDLVLPDARDDDGDGVPDVLENLLCGVENQNYDWDGACSNGSYEAPL